MGDDIKKATKRGLGVDILKPLRTGASAVRRETKQATELQQQKEELRVAEAESDIARRKLTSKTGGRRSLIKTTPSGLALNLGGTA